MSARYYEAVGRRKTSSARVRLYPGTGTIVVNERPAVEYFPRETDMMLINRPLQMTETSSSYNISIHVQGGGLTGQAGAVVQGIARGAVRRRREPAPRAEEERLPGSRCARQGTQEVRSEARPQGSAVHEALVSGSWKLEAGSWSFD